MAMNWPFLVLVTKRVNDRRDGSSNYLNKGSADIGSTLTGVMVITIIN